MPSSTTNDSQTRLRKRLSQLSKPNRRTFANRLLPIAHIGDRCNQVCRRISLSLQPYQHYHHHPRSILTGHIPSPFAATNVSADSSVASIFQQRSAYRLRTHPFAHQHRLSPPKPISFPIHPDDRLATHSRVPAKKSVSVRLRKQNLPQRDASRRKLHSAKALFVHHAEPSLVFVTNTAFYRQFNLAPFTSPTNTKTAVTHRCDVRFVPSTPFLHRTERLPKAVKMRRLKSRCHRPPNREAGSSITCVRVDLRCAPILWAVNYSAHCDAQRSVTSPEDSGFELFDPGQQMHGTRSRNGRNQLLRLGPTWEDENKRRCR
uniref:Uncharacterized protein n=1 Tax=Mycena chlorophos TaxID=658473 RepID=A0ABQ0L977_MYCCL|nr:predicted protein [Mycena chlorophos]